MFLKNESLILRAIEKEDADVLYEMINDPAIESTVGGWSLPVSKQQQEAWINNLQNDKTIRYAIDVGNGIVGTAMISDIDYKNSSAELHIKLPVIEHGKGYATDAVELLLKYCFCELNLNCVYVNVLENNTVSRKLWEHKGFVFEGLLRNRVYKQGEYKNIVSYSLLKVEYETRNRK